MAYRAGDIPVARAYLDRHAAEGTARILDLLAVWSQEMDDQAQRREAEVLRFGLKTSTG